MCYNFNDIFFFCTKHLHVQTQNLQSPVIYLLDLPGNKKNKTKQNNNNENRNKNLKK